MSAGLDGFNAIARQYDFLKQLAFGRSIYRSQVSFLAWIPGGGKVLIIGGGSGAILPVMAAANPDADVWFIEASSEMLRIARKRLPAIYAKKVRFIHGTETDLPDGVLFDAVITNFFLDLFPDPKVQELCTLMTSRLKGNGLWLVSDFIDGKKIWQRFLLWVMYRFFSLTCDVEAGKLPAWDRHIKTTGMQEISSRSFFRGFIRSVLYQRKSIHFSRQ
jgi:tRNA (cmo5U34)-methyltransferase